MSFLFAIRKVPHKFHPLNCCMDSATEGFWILQRKHGEPKPLPKKVLCMLGHIRKKYSMWVMGRWRYLLCPKQELKRIAKKIFIIILKLFPSIKINIHNYKFQHPIYTMRTAKRRPCRIKVFRLYCDFFRIYLFFNVKLKVQPKRIYVDILHYIRYCKVIMVKSIYYSHLILMFNIHLRSLKQPDGKTGSIRNSIEDEYQSQISTLVNTSIQAFAF